MGLGKNMDSAQNTVVAQKLFLSQNRPTVECWNTFARLEPTIVKIAINPCVPCS